jgi:hypothetical protein
VDLKRSREREVTRGRKGGREGGRKGSDIPEE